MRAKLIQKTWMGMNIVAWCDENGRVCVAEAYCPHLGSDLGPAAGGGAYAMAGSSVLSMALIRYCRPVRRHSLFRPTQVREVGSLRNAGSSRPDLRLVGDPGTSVAMEPTRGSAGPSRLEWHRDQDQSLSRASAGDDGELSGFGPPALRPRLRQRGPHRASVGGRALSREPLERRTHWRNMQERALFPRRQYVSDQHARSLRSR